jgi:ABC-type sugar transport system substrate-binding protein
MKKLARTGALLAVIMVLLIVTACSKTKDTTPAAAPAETKAPTVDATAAPAADPNKKITLGFSQVGAESGWRAANTKSVQESAKEFGIDLKFSDAQQKQENQIKAIRTYIQQKVDYIAFSPVVESGWDTVLKEAKDAGIPVLLTDRAVDVADTSLYVTFMGSDFVEEGRKAGKWVVDTFKDKKDINIVELQGTTGSSPAIDRKKGFEEAIKDSPNLKIVKTQTGEFTRAKGKEVMESFLKSMKSEGKKIDLLYAHNDDMGLGAIQAIEEAGLVPGKDIMIVTVDAVKDGMTAAADGKINYIVECSPMLGGQLMQSLKDLASGKTLAKRIVTKEGTFTPDQAKAALPTRPY